MMNHALDTSLAEFLHEAAAQLGPSVIELAQRRERYNRIAMLAGAPHAPGVKRADVLVPSANGHGVPVRIYTPGGTPGNADAPLAIYLHGGGWSAGGIASHDGLCAWLAYEADVELAAVEYRLSPEHAHPAALDDAETALRWALAQHRPVLMVGDSAGGHLAAGATLRAVEGASLCSLLHGPRGTESRGAVHWLGLLYPAASPKAEFASHREHAHSVGLSRTNLMQYWEWLGGAQGRANPDPHFDLLQVRDWRGLPPTHILSAELDPLRDEAQALAAAMSASRVPVSQRCAQGMPHGFARFVSRSPAAMAEMKDFASRLRQAGAAARSAGADDGVVVTRLFGVAENS